MTGDAPPPGSFDVSAAAQQDAWRPPGSLDEQQDLAEPSFDPPPGDTTKPDAPPRPLPAGPTDLLRRAALGGPPVAPEPGAGTIDDPDLWDDPASIRELRMLTRLGAITAVFAAILVAGLLDDTPGHGPGLAVGYALGTVVLCGFAGLLVYGFFATFRRGAYLWLALGFVLTPLVYAAWAALLLVRMRRARG